MKFHLDEKQRALVVRVWHQRVKELWGKESQGVPLQCASRAIRSSMLVLLKKFRCEDLEEPEYVCPGCSSSLESSLVPGVFLCTD